MITFITGYYISTFISVLIALFIFELNWSDGNINVSNILINAIVWSAFVTLFILQFFREWERGDVDKNDRGGLFQERNLAGGFFCGMASGVYLIIADIAGLMLLKGKLSALMLGIYVFLVSSFLVIINYLILRFYYNAVSSNERH